MLTLVLNFESGLMYGFKGDILHCICEIFHMIIHALENNLNGEKHRCQIMK